MRSVLVTRTRGLHVHDQSVDDYTTVISSTVYGLSTASQCPVTYGNRSHLVPCSALSSPSNLFFPLKTAKSRRSVQESRSLNNEDARVAKCDAHTTTGSRHAFKEKGRKTRRHAGSGEINETRCAQRHQPILQYDSGSSLNGMELLHKMQAVHRTSYGNNFAGTNGTVTTVWVTTVADADVVVTGVAYATDILDHGSGCRVDDVLHHHTKHFDHGCRHAHRRRRYGRERWLHHHHSSTKDKRRIQQLYEEMAIFTVARGRTTRTRHG